MKYQLKFVNSQSSEARKLEGGYSYWHDPVFMTAVAKLHQVEAMQLQVIKGEELFAILPVYERKKLGLKALVSITGSYYQGICFDFAHNCNPGRKLLDALAASSDIAQFLSSHYRWVRIQLNPDNQDIRGFTWRGYKARPLYTFRRHLDREPQALPDQRRNLRMAKKAGLRLVEAFELEQYMKLQKDLEKRKDHGMGVSYSALEDFYVHLYEEGLLKILSVYHEDEIVSSNILLTDGQEIAYITHLATALKALKLGAAAYHYMELANHLPKKTRILDYCGANVKEVARFKGALGADLQSFYHLSL